MEKPSRIIARQLMAGALYAEASRHIHCFPIKFKSIVYKTSIASGPCRVKSQCRGFNPYPYPSLGRSWGQKLVSCGFVVALSWGRYRGLLSCAGLSMFSFYVLILCSINIHICKCVHSSFLLKPLWYRETTSWQDHGGFGHCKLMRRVDL